MLFDKKLLVCLVVSIIGVFQPTTHQEVLDNNAQINFYLPSDRISGSMNALQTEVYFDPLNLPESKIKASVETSSLKTGNIARDLRFNSKKMLNKKMYPKITFVSSQILESSHSYLVIGDLTIKNIKKQTAFEIQVQDSIIEGVSSINLLDFDIAYSEKRVENKVDIFIKLPINK